MAQLDPDPAVRTRDRRNSTAISALSTALPRSSSTRTPPGPSTSSIAAATAVASVPNVVSSGPGRHRDPRRYVLGDHLAAPERPRPRPAHGCATPRRCRSRDRVPGRSLTPDSRQCRRGGLEHQRRTGGAGVLVTSRCARRGSWPVPCGPPERQSASRPRGGCLGCGLQRSRRGRRPRPDRGVVRVQRPATRRRTWSCRRARPCPGRWTPSTPACSACADRRRVHRLRFLRARPRSAGRTCRRAVRSPRRRC